MKRKYKNIITIAVGALLLGATIFTVICAKNDAENNQPAMNMGMVGEQSESIGNMESMGTPPEQPTTNTESSNMSTPPEKPSGDNSSNTETPPEKPGEESSNSADSAVTPPTMPSEAQGEMAAMPTSSTGISVIFCVLISVEILLLSLVVAYLIMSQFNQKTFKETFATGEKVAIFILSSILATAVLACCIILLTNNCLISSGREMSENSTTAGAFYSASTEITESKTIDGETFESTNKDENALSVSGNIEVTATNITVNKTGDSDGGDSTSFYGTNSAIIAKNGATLNLKNAKITTDATGANGVFSYGGSATTSNTSSDGTTVNISDSTIITKKDNSGGIMTTGGGIMNASNLTIETAGTSSAAIRSDRGGGTVTVDGGTYKTTGQGSPAIYSTADITVKNANLVASVSEGAIIEGKNSINLENVTLTDSNTKLNGQSTTYKNIFLYQSMSGDADSGTSQFVAKDSTITTNNGDSIYVTNTTASIMLTNNKFINNDSNGNFLRIKADAWGNEGSNGGVVNLIMSSQEVAGNIVVDFISTLDMTMNSQSKFTGTINGDNSAQEIKLKLDKDSQITLTGNSYVTSLEDADTSYGNINFNGYKLYVNGVAIN
jgi:hypothetical protein